MPWQTSLLVRWWSALVTAEHLKARNSAADENHPEWPTLPLRAWLEPSECTTVGGQALQDAWVSTMPVDRLDATDV